MRLIGARSGHDDDPLIMEPLEPEEGIEIPYDQLAPETLVGVIESFILRNGTDYGAVEAKLETMVTQVKRQLERGEAVIVFDGATETCSIQPKRR